MSAEHVLNLVSSLRRAHALGPFIADLTASPAMIDEWRGLEAKARAAADGLLADGWDECQISLLRRSLR